MLIPRPWNSPAPPPLHRTPHSRPALPSPKFQGREFGGAGGGPPPPSRPKIKNIKTRRTPCPSLRVLFPELPRPDYRPYPILIIGASPSARIPPRPYPNHHARHIRPCPPPPTPPASGRRYRRDVACNVSTTTPAHHRCKSTDNPDRRKISRQQDYIPPDRTWHFFLAQHYPTAPIPPYPALFSALPP